MALPPKPIGRAALAPLPQTSTPSGGKVLPIRRGGRSMETITPRSQVQVTQSAEAQGWDQERIDAERQTSEDFWEVDRAGLDIEPEFSHDEMSGLFKKRLTIAGTRFYRDSKGVMRMRAMHHSLCSPYPPKMIHKYRLYRDRRGVCRFRAGHRVSGRDGFGHRTGSSVSGGIIPTTTYNLTSSGAFCFDRAPTGVTVPWVVGLCLPTETWVQILATGQDRGNTEAPNAPWFHVHLNSFLPGARGHRPLESGEAPGAYEVNRKGGQYVVIPLRLCNYGLDTGSGIFTRSWISSLLTQDVIDREPRAGQYTGQSTEGGPMLALTVAFCRRRQGTGSIPFSNSFNLWTVWRKRSEANLFSSPPEIRVDPGIPVSWVGSLSIECLPWLPMPLGRTTFYGTDPNSVPLHYPDELSWTFPLNGTDDSQTRRIPSILGNNQQIQWASRVPFITPLPRYPGWGGGVTTSPFIEGATFIPYGTWDSVSNDVSAVSPGYNAVEEDPFLKLYFRAAGILAYHTDGVRSDGRPDDPGRDPNCTGTLEGLE